MRMWHPMLHHVFVLGWDMVECGNVERFFLSLFLLFRILKRKFRDKNSLSKMADVMSKMASLGAAERTGNFEIHINQFIKNNLDT